MRYGVLVDLATKVFRNEQISLEMGSFNCIWQGDANAMALACFDLTATPSRVLNLTGPDVISTRSVCEEFGRRMNRNVRFVGQETSTALLSDAGRTLNKLGPLRVTSQELIHWTADWVNRGGENLNRPTHFDEIDGKF